MAIPPLPNLAQEPISLAIPITANGDEPNCYYAEYPRLEVIRTENFVGSVAEGGVCNHKKLTITPHGNGTHTESIGHILAEQYYVNQVFKKFFFPAQLISLEPTLLNGDQIIQSEEILSALQRNPYTEWWVNQNEKSLIIRTLPNYISKRNQNYSGTNPPYFEKEVGELLASWGVTHWLCDLPSVDKENDGGKLATHKAFWQYPEKPRHQATITELIFVPNTIKDGFYWLNLQIINLASDATPSNPVLYII